MIPICLPSNDNSLVGEVGNFPEFLLVSFLRASTIFWFLRLFPFTLLYRLAQLRGGADCPSMDKYLPSSEKFSCQSYQTASAWGCIGNRQMSTLKKTSKICTCPGILVKMSGSRRSSCARAPRQAGRTVVRGTAEVPWWSRYAFKHETEYWKHFFLVRERMEGGNLLGSSAGGSAVATGIDPECTREFQSFAPGSGTW